MIERYDAFISYKHATIDNKVAESIEKGLERFHIPKKIQQKTGKKRIQQIFRDKDELPITSNLSDQISYALDHSEFLIVICSTNTKQSAWVPREIEYFLRRHDRNHVLTVLVDGEPQDVIPDILLHDTRTYYDHSGVLQTINADLEPLSCDYRMSLRKAKKEELPRLASALLGCSYDELMNRRRQYKVRRMALAFSALLLLTFLFSGYMAYSRYRIQKNYNDSLRNQSRYLANEAQALLKNEQRITALQLTLAALPKDKNDERPVTPEAVKALTEATLSYVKSDSSYITDAWNYECANTVEYFKLSPDENTIAAIDEVGSIYMWNNQTHELLLSSESAYDTASSFIFVNDDMLVVEYSEMLVAYDTKSGSTLWKSENDRFEYGELLTNSAKTSVVYATTDSVFYIDPSTGNVTDTIEISDSSDIISSSSASNYVFSPDDSKIAYTITTDFACNEVEILDIKTGKKVSSNLQSEYLHDIYWVNDESILVVENSNTMSSSMSFNNVSYLKNDTSTIYCLDASDMSEIWKTDFQCSEVTIENNFFNLNDNTIAYFSGNICTFIDKKTGDIKKSYNANDSIIDISDENEDGIPVIITTEGGIAYPPKDEENNYLIMYKSLTNNLSLAEVGYNIYTSQFDSNKIICYKFNMEDDEWTEVSTDIGENTPLDTYVDDRIIASIGTSGEDNVLYLCDPGSPEVRTLSLSSIDGFNSFEILGTKKDKMYLTADGDDGIAILTVDMISLDTSVSDILIKYSSNVRSNHSFYDGKYAYYDNTDYDNPAVVVYDIDNSSKQQFKVSHEPAIGGDTTLEFNNSDYLVFSSESVHVCDLKSGEVNSFSISDSWKSTNIVSISDDKHYIAFSNGNRITVTDPKGERIMDKGCPGTEPIGMAFFKEKRKSPTQLVVIYSNGTLYRYDVKTGEFLGKNELTVYSSRLGSDYAELTFDRDKNQLYVQMNSILDLVDLENWYETASIYQAVGLHRPSDRVYTYAFENDKTTSLGYFKHYTTDELIEKGKKILHDTELSEELKYKYGITEDE